MVWFKQLYLSWIIICADAVCVLSQEVNSTLRNGNHACRDEEVIFTCTIRNVSDSVLAWSSAEYIGQGNPLRFTAQDMPGANMTSMNNGNVTAKLIRNTNIDGVPTLVSELCIIADQDSTVTCTSETTSSTNSTIMFVSDVPEAPVHIGSEYLQSSEDVCEILINWDPPATSLDIERYAINIPLLNLDFNETSLIFYHLSRDCPESIDVKLAAVNRFGCMGINSELQLALQSTISESSQFGVDVVVGIVVGIGLIPAVFLLIISFLIFVIIYRCRTGRFLPQDEQRQRLLKEKEDYQEDLEKALTDLYEALKLSSSSNLKSSVDKLIGMLKEKAHVSSCIRDAVNCALEKIKVEDGQDVATSLDNLFTVAQNTMTHIDKKLKGIGVSMASLSKEAEAKNHHESFNKLKEKVASEKPKKVQDLLQELCEELQNGLTGASPSSQTKAKPPGVPMEAFAEVESKHT